MVEVAFPKANAYSESIIGYWIFAIEELVAIAIGLGLTALGLGSAAWILGGIGAGALVFYGYRILGNFSIQPNRRARKVGQIIIGLTIGLSLQQSNLTVFSSHWLFLLGLPLFLLISGGLIGGIYSRIEKTDLLTAMLATSPGNIGVMASMAADYSKSASLVSLVQLMRFTSVILVMPMIANRAIAHSTHPSFKELLNSLLTLQISQLSLPCLVLAVTSLAVYLAGKLKIPVAGFFCAIAIGLVFDILPFLFPPLASFDFRLPPLFNIVGQVLLGITIGEYWGINPKLKGSTVTNAVIPVSLMFGVTFLAAAGARLLTSWDWLTCLLIAAPGGSPEMIWIALTLNHNVEIITAGHLIRLLIINLSLPGLISVACYLDRESESI
ncbi:AbrB family transcriptional regulator [Leptothermofonsia sp. ETS-13]|uniref:AbrB family transcriptional regulator n=1 Tax=Leptothermofonsia sp. ETS-13 TaxID=3035696 RepID=UPI003BA1C8C4